MLPIFQNRRKLHADIQAATQIDVCHSFQVGWFFRWFFRLSCESGYHHCSQIFAYSPFDKLFSHVFFRHLREFDGLWVHRCGSLYFGRSNSAHIGETNDIVDGFWGRRYIYEWRWTFPTSTDSTLIIFWNARTSSPGFIRPLQSGALFSAAG